MVRDADEFDHIGLGAPVGELLREVTSAKRTTRAYRPIVQPPKNTRVPIVLRPVGSAQVLGVSAHIGAAPAISIAAVVARVASTRAEVVMAAILPTAVAP